MAWSTFSVSLNTINFFWWPSLFISKIGLNNNLSLALPLGIIAHFFGWGLIGVVIDIFRNLISKHLNKNYSNLFAGTTLICLILGSYHFLLGPPIIEPLPLESEATDPYTGSIPSAKSKVLKTDENGNGLWDLPESIIIQSVGADRRTTEAFLAKLKYEQETIENATSWTSEQLDIYRERNGKLIWCSISALHNSPFRHKASTIVQQKYSNTIWRTVEGKASSEFIDNYFAGKILPGTSSLNEQQCQALINEMLYKKY